ncbi:MAG: CBS domain-containing protein [Clostridia bacterium]|nr:CBS domain-containing protein [Clostridia bacterium]
MNLAMIMIPKVCTVFLRENQTIRQGWEIMKQHRYTAIPVLDENDRYSGIISEGDFLRFVINTESTDVQNMEKHRVIELVRKDFCPPLEIDADVEQVIDSILRQNFVPIVDSRGALSGILTRQGVIKYLAGEIGINKAI